MTPAHKATQTVAGVALWFSAVAFALATPPQSGATFVAVLLWLAGCALLVGAWRRG